MTLKEKLAANIEIELIKIEIANYEEAMRSISKFADYHRSRIAVLEGRIEDVRSRTYQEVL